MQPQRERKDSQRVDPRSSPYHDVLSVGGVSNQQKLYFTNERSSQSRIPTSQEFALPAKSFSSVAIRESFQIESAIGSKGAILAHDMKLSPKWPRGEGDPFPLDLCRELFDGAEMSLIKKIWSGLDSRLDKKQYLQWFGYLTILLLVGEVVLNAAVIKMIPCASTSRPSAALVRSRFGARSLRS